jgi:aspartyl-tRNA(Asn)/glutamyl-tRNA(Gln) amidotransferase subunit B
LLADPLLVKKAINWLVGDYQSQLSASPEGLRLSGANLVELINLIESGEISSKIAKHIFPDVAKGISPKELVLSQGLKQVSDDSQLEAVINKVISENPGPLKDYRSGNERVLGFFIGQVMKDTNGQANPSKVNELMIKLLKE